ncbi:M15 family metallopeptidase [Halanaerobaculum tunisiense]
MATSIKALYDKSLPEQKSLDWSKIKKKRIVECRERLVSMSLKPDKILVNSQYYLQQIQGAMPECYCREGVFDRLIKAADKLPAGYKLVIFDAWRSDELQLSLFNKYKTELRKEMPEKSEQELTQITEQFVSLPSKDPTQPSPHNTGGAVDLTIVDDRGKPLEMGTRFDETKEESITYYYERIIQQEKELSSKERKILQNRRLLYNVMTEVGFTNYPKEWWHYDYGNQNWAWMNEQPHAIYGMTKPFFRWN